MCSRTAGRGVVGLISNFLDISGSGKPCQAVKDDESGSARFEASEVPYLPNDEASPVDNLMLGCN